MAQVENNSSPERLAYGKLLIISMAYIALGLNVQGFTAMLPLVRSDLMMSSTQAGLYTTFFFLSATVIAVFSGRVVDALGSKRGLVLGAFIVGTVMLLHAFAPVLLVLLVLAFFTGIGFSIITPSVNKGVMELVPPRRRALSLGITQAGGGIGAILGASLLPLFGQIYGWRPTIFVAGLVAIGFSLLLLLAYHPPRPVSDGSSSAGFWQDLKSLLGSKALLCVGMMGFLFGFTLSSVTTHLAIFLNHEIGFTPALAGFALAVFQMGGVFGKTGWGYINDTYLWGNRRMGFLLIGVLAAVATLLLGTLVPMGVISGAGVFLVVFFFGATGMGIPGLFFASVGDIVSDKLMGTATGLSLVFIRVGVVTGPPLFGLIADWQNSYSLSWVLLGVLMLTLTGLFFVLAGRFLPASVAQDM